MTDLDRRTPGMLRDTKGVSAIEFAIGATILVPSIIAMVDLGLGWQSRLLLDRSLRSGAEAIMLGEDDPGRVRDVIEAAADCSDACGSIGLQVAMPRVVCRCGGGDVACDTTCSGGASPTRHMVLSATRTRTRLFGGSQEIEERISVRVP